MSNEYPDNEVVSITFDFKDQTSLNINREIIDIIPFNLKMDFMDVISKIHDEIDIIKQKAIELEEENNQNNILGINVKEDVKSKDIFGR